MISVCLFTDREGSSQFRDIFQRNLTAMFITRLNKKRSQIVRYAQKAMADFKRGLPSGAIESKRAEFLRIHASLAAMTQLDQTIVLLHLADNVEHNLNYGSTYYSAQERSSYCPSNGNLMIEMANILGFPFLAQYLEAVQRQNPEIQIPHEFHSTHRRGFLIPKSLTKRWPLIGHKYWKDGLQRFRYRVSSHIRPLRKVVKKVKTRFGVVQ